MEARSLCHFKGKRAQVHWPSVKKTQVHLRSRGEGASADMRLICVAKRRLNFGNEDRKYVYDTVSHMATPSYQSFFYGNA